SVQPVLDVQLRQLQRAVRHRESAGQAAADRGRPARCRLQHRYDRPGSVRHPGSALLPRRVGALLKETTDSAPARKSGGAILERMTRLARRGFLEGCAAAAIGTLLTRSPRAVAHEAPPSLTTTSLGDGLWLIAGAGCNVVAAAGPEGALLIDGGLEAHSSRLVKAALQATQSRRVHVLFNTHWHPEQTGSNERLGKDGALIVAHENTRLWLSRPIETDWLPQLYGPLPPQARPTRTTYTTD